MFCLGECFSLMFNAMIAFINKRIFYLFPAMKMIHRRKQKNSLNLSQRITKRKRRKRLNNLLHSQQLHLTSIQNLIKIQFCILYESLLTFEFWTANWRTFWNATTQQNHFYTLYVNVHYIQSLRTIYYYFLNSEFQWNLRFFY